MSLRTWKAEFYPVTASKVKKKDAVAVSLLKWSGMTKKNLAKHSVEFSGGDVFDPTTGEVFYNYSETCALCAKYATPNYNNDDCGKCPLFLSRGEVSCFVATGSERMLSPFAARMTSPLPMISALKKAAKWEEKSKQKAVKKQNDHDVPDDGGKYEVGQ